MVISTSTAVTSNYKYSHRQVVKSHHPLSKPFSTASRTLIDPNKDPCILEPL